MKPLPSGSSFPKNALHYVVAGLNIDGCRIGESGGTQKAGPPSYKPGTTLMGSLDGSLNGGGVEDIDKGRFPPNIIIDPYVARWLAYKDGKLNRFFYCAKASKGDRNQGAEHLQSLQPGGMSGRNDGSMGSITYNQNHHPTVKPTTLMKWLLDYRDYHTARS